MESMGVGGAVMLLDLLSYLLGYNKGSGTVEIEDGGVYDYTDPNSDGNIVITKEG